MKSICAWCEAELPPTEGIDNQQITHGICDTCMLFYTAKKERLRDFINDFDQPIMIISNEGRVKTANDIALSAINKTLDNVIDQLGGMSWTVLTQNYPKDVVEQNIVQDVKFVIQ